MCRRFKSGPCHQPQPPVTQAVTASLFSPEALAPCAILFAHFRHENPRKVAHEWHTPRHRTATADGIRTATKRPRVRGTGVWHTSGTRPALATARRRCCPSGAFRRGRRVHVRRKRSRSAMAFYGLGAMVAAAAAPMVSTQPNVRGLDGDGVAPASGGPRDAQRGWQPGSVRDRVSHGEQDGGKVLRRWHQLTQAALGVARRARR